MRHLKTLASAIVVVLVLVMATDYIAMAATGKPLILGKVNKSGKTTTIKSAKGSALSLKTKPGKPPLKVDSDTVVKKLNADLLDGRNSTSYLNRSTEYRWALVDQSATSMVLTVPGVTPGTYLASYSIYMPSVYGDGECYMRVRTGDGENVFVTAESRAASPDRALGFSASGLVRIGSGNQLQVRCSGPDATTFSTPSSEPAQIVLTKLDSAPLQVFSGSFERAGAKPLSRRD